MTEVKHTSDSRIVQLMGYCILT